MKRIIDQMAYTSEVAQYSVLSATKRNVDKSSVAKSTMKYVVCDSTKMVFTIVIFHP